MMTAEQRFWPKVNPCGPVHPTLGTECWLWVGSRDGAGYGHFGLDRRVEKAHRVAYELRVGPIPKGLALDHLCRNTSCVNPTHLEPVTSRVNSLRGVGVGAVNAKKTHCPKGHEYTPENTYSYKPTFRQCRICHNEATARHRAKVSA